jgi:hypothetical protein
VPPTVKFKRGALSGLPSLAAGQPGVTTDQVRLYVGSAGGNLLVGLLHKNDGTTAPTVNEDAGDGYSVGSTWTDTTNAKTYTLVDSTVGAAVWKQTGGAGSGTAYTADESTLHLSGTTFSVLDAELLALAALTSAADKVPYFTGSGAAALADLTSAGRAVIAGVNTAAQRIALGGSTLGINLFTTATPGAQSYVRVETDGSLTFLSQAGVKSDLSLNSVTNDAQTKAAVVPNTAPSAGQILAGNAGGTAYAPVTVSGSGGTITLSSAGVITISAIPNASLSNSTVTVNGTSIALGASATVTAAAGTLTGATLNSTVVTSSLTAVGTVTTGTWSATTVAVDKGGTGQTTYTDGQLLIGNTTGNTLAKATLTAGTGVSVTNGHGTITVANTGVTSVATAGLATGGAITTTGTVTVTAAVQSDQETGTSTAVAVVPGVQQYHPSACKAWGNLNGTGTISLRASYNLDACTDNGVGDYTFNITTDFSSANYGFSAVAGRGSSAATGLLVLAPDGGANPTAGAFRLFTLSAAFAVQDAQFVGICFFGDQ